MKLLLYSSSSSDENLRIFKDFFDIEPVDLKVCLVSNARDLSEDQELEEVTAKVHELEALGFRVETLDLLQVQNVNELRAQLELCDVLWVRGGQVGLLLKAMQESKLDTILPDLLENGLRYVGSSAGSMVLSQHLDAAAHYPDDEAEPHLEFAKGLGYNDFQIFPHAQRFPREEIIDNFHEGKLYYLVPDGAAIGVDGDQIEFYGEEIEEIYI